MADTQQWMMVKEVAAELRLSPMTIYRLVRAGSIPAHKFGRSFRIDRNDVLAYKRKSKTWE